MVVSSASFVYRLLFDFFPQPINFTSGCITAHCGSNGTHIICDYVDYFGLHISFLQLIRYDFHFFVQGIAGEPRHGHNGNSETVVQIGKIQYLELL